MKKPSRSQPSTQYLSAVSVLFSICLVTVGGQPLESNQFFKAAGEAKQVSTSRRAPSHAPLPRSPRAGGMNKVPVCQVRVVGGFLMVATFVMLGCFVVVACSVLKMLGCPLVMMGCFLRHV
jgi:hypothetical protein